MLQFCGRKSNGTKTTMAMTILTTKWKWDRAQKNEEKTTKRKPQPESKRFQNDVFYDRLAREVILQMVSLIQPGVSWVNQGPPLSVN